MGTSLVVQALRLRTPNVGDPTSIPVRELNPCMPQWRLKLLSTATKTRCSQINNKEITH